MKKQSRMSGIHKAPTPSPLIQQVDDVELIPVNTLFDHYLNERIKFLKKLLNDDELSLEMSNTYKAIKEGSSGYGSYDEARLYIDTFDKALTEATEAERVWVKMRFGI